MSVVCENIYLLLGSIIGGRLEPKERITFALTSEVSQQAFSHRLKSLRVLQKQGNWPPYELKLRNVKR